MNQIQGDIVDASAPIANSTPTVRVKIENLCKDFRTSKGVTNAVQNVSLDIQRGEFVTLVGRSGCGKTTLLRMIGGLLAPTSGTVHVDGKELWRNGRVDSAAIARLGFVFQDSNLLPWFTVIDNIALPLKLRGVSKAERRERATTLAGLVGLAGFEHSYPRQLSGGMRQRVAIARALSTEPDLLLMDEPFASVDAQTRGDLEDLTLALKNHLGITIMLVTHDIDEAVYLSDRVLVLGKKPTQVVDLIETHLGTGRDQITTKATPEFTELRSRVYQEIRHGDIPSSTGSVAAST